MTQVFTPLPRSSGAVSKPQGVVLREEKPMTVGAALTIWVGLSLVGWAAIIGLGYLII